MKYLLRVFIDQFLRRIVPKVVYIVKQIQRFNKTVLLPHKRRVLVTE